MRKNAAIFLLISFVFICFSGCAKLGATQSDVLTVYVLKDNPSSWSTCDTWRYTLAGFAEEYEDTVLEAVEFSTMAELEEQLLRELSEGGGPDLILYSWQNSLDIYKLARDGLLLDLNLYLEDDGSYSRSAYLESLLDSGNFDGAQYLMPICYPLPLFLTSEEKLAEAGVADPEQVLTSREVMQIITEQGEQHANDQENFGFIDFQFGNTKEAFFSSTGMFELDYSAGSVSVDREGFREMMELYLAASDEASRALENLSSGYSFKLQVQDLVKRGTFFGAYFNSLQTILSPALVLSAEETPIIEILPTFDQTDSYRVSTCFAAINRQAKNPDTAYEVIRYLMDHVIRHGADGVTPAEYQSINKSVALSQVERVYQSVVGQGTPSQEEFFDAFVARYEAFLSGDVQNFAYPNALYERIAPCAQALRSNPDAFDEAFDTMMTDLDAYMMEPVFE